MVRLQKFLSQSGIASRREAEKMIAAGRIEVNGKGVTSMGTKVDPAVDRVTVDGGLVTAAPAHAYYLFYKPRKVMVTRHDPEGRPTVIDYIKNIPVRLNPVGRLDFDSEGLLLLTNDGELHNKLIHPRHEVAKTYRVLVAPPGGREHWVKVVPREGKNRQIRRMFAAQGLEVRRLIRTKIGPVGLGGLGPGQVRPLSQRELQLLRENC